MQDTDKREEHEEHPASSSDVHASGSTAAEAGAVTDESPALDAGRATLSRELAEAEAPAASEESIAEFADSVVFGLEQAAFALEELEETQHRAEPYRGTTEPQKGPEAVFTAWSGFDISRRDAGHIVTPPPKPASPPQPPKDAPSLRSLSDAGIFSGYGSSPASSSTKHDELADAVQSALFSVYGDEPQPEPEVPPYQSAGFEEQSLASLARIRAQGTGLGLPSDTPPSEDGLTPQDVIMNYFDYSPEEHATKGASNYARDDGLTPQEVILNYFDYPNGQEEDSRGRENSRDSYGAPPHSYNGGYNGGTPLTNRHRPDPMPHQPQPQVNWSEQDYQPQRQDWDAPITRSAQYSGPPAYQVPAKAPAPSKEVAAAVPQENSRLLGAAAIGLMGGIAIAASLTILLLNGVEIPGFGGLRVDRGDQGYGVTQDDAAVREPTPIAPPKPAPVYASEVLAADVVAVPGQPAQLSIAIKSDQPFEKTFISITGVPEGGRLSAGVDAGNGNWLLPPRRLAGLTISLPAGAEPVPLEVQLLDSNTRAPLSAKTAFSVAFRPGGPSFATPGMGGMSGMGGSSQVYVPRNQQPPSFNAQTQPQVPAAPGSSQTPPPFGAFRAPIAPAGAPATLGPRPGTTQTTPPRPTVRPEVEDLIREGNKHMREGDILEARQFYQKAVVLNDAEAMLAMGRSYDPIYFARIERKNAEPDAAKAFEWYKKAMDAGATQTAMVRIENLKHFLNE